MSNKLFFPFFSQSVIDTVIVPVQTGLTSRSELLGQLGVLEQQTGTLSSQSTFVGRPRVNVARTAGLRASFVATGIGQVDRPTPALTTSGAFVFPFNRWAWPGAVVTDIYGGYFGNYVPSNTQLQQRSKVARLASLSTIQCDFGNAYRLNAVAFVSHNMGRFGTFRIQISNDSTFSNIKYDSGTVEMWEASFINAGQYEEEVVFDGQPSDQLVEMLKYCGNNPRVARWHTFDEVAARYMRITVNDSSVDGFIEISYIYAGLVVQVSPGQEYGWSINPVSHSRVRKSASGSVWTDTLYRQLVATASFTAQSEDMALAFWNTFSHYAGTRREFIISFQPDGFPRKFWYTLYGRFRQTPQITQISRGVYRCELEVEELAG